MIRPMDEENELPSSRICPTDLQIGRGVVADQSPSCNLRLEPFDDPLTDLVRVVLHQQPNAWPEVEGIDVLKVARRPNRILRSHK